MMPPENQSDSVPGVWSTKLLTNCVREGQNWVLLFHTARRGVAVNQFDAWILKNRLRWTTERGSLMPGAVNITFTTTDDLQMSGLVPLTNCIHGNLVHQEGLPQEEVWENFWKNIKQANILISHPISQFTPPVTF
ncbi:hypothetical protein EDD16DRAFT_1793600 [Pisolithus croceorrhizus]|nr:hypothetical protein EDD16DRAFT_1793600 [Pisolithus croceorrhizus]